MRQLLIYHDTRLLDDWDQVAALYSATHNLMALVSKALNKRSPLQFQTAQECHPFRRKRRKSSGLEITPENFGSLKSIFQGLSGQPKRKRRGRKGGPS